MKHFFLAAALIGLCGSIASGQWQTQTVDTKADLRGLCVVSRNVAWASGTAGTRFAKTEGKLFTFLDHDNVPWNNNPAEHAVKAFAWYRMSTDGKMGEDGLLDYLVLLSVQQTCKYRGVSFLKFLLSQEEDVEAYSRHPRRNAQPPALEVYPENFSGTRFKREEPNPTAESLDPGLAPRGT
jgi:hypothetical protein